MKYRLLIFLFLLAPFLVRSQNIVDIFYLLPSNYSSFLDLNQKQLAINIYNSKTSKMPEKERSSENCDDYIEILDISNGYMKLSTACGDGTYEMCYWKMEDGNKLIATNSDGYSTSQTTSFIQFFILTNDKNLEPMSSDSIIPYESIKKTLLKEKIETKYLNIFSIEELYDNDFVIFKLPRYGRAISVHLGHDGINQYVGTMLNQKECKLYWDKYSLKLSK